MISAADTTDTADTAHSPTCTCREHPLPATLQMREARDAYFAENGFTTEGYESPTTKGSLFGVPITVPNPPAHQRGLRLHDLLHVVTGYGTDHAGEAELSVWQIKMGLRGAGGYVTAIVAFNVAVGLVLAPRRTLAAAAATSTDGGSLFSTTQAYESLLLLTVGELLGVPSEGVCVAPRRLHAQAPRPG